MAYDYDKLYGETADALGQPTRIIVNFFKKIERKELHVLDIGCGQGRDALFIARLGHRVVGIDISPNGINDMTAAAAAENLPVEGIVADISDYAPEDAFDIILIDRTLHMLPKPKRLSVLGRLLDHVNPESWVLIADEASNMKDFEAVLAKSNSKWTTELTERGYLFVQRH